MITFNNFILERVYRLTPEEQQQVDDLVNNYKNLFLKDTKTKVEISKVGIKNYFKKDLDRSKKNLYLGTIKYLDLADNITKETNVFVNIAKNPPSNGSYYDDTNEIYLYYWSLGYSVTKVADTLTHELLHAKQQYKKMSPEYKEAVRKRKSQSGQIGLRSYRKYYFNPLEMPVYTTLLVRDMLKEYKQSEGMEKFILKDFLKDFIKGGAKIDFSNERTPAFILDKRDFLNFLYKNRKHKKYYRSYNNFLKKLYWAYSKMK